MDLQQYVFEVGSLWMVKLTDDKIAEFVHSWIKTEKARAIVLKAFIDGFVVTIVKMDDKHITTTALMREEKVGSELKLNIATMASWKELGIIKMI